MIARFHYNDDILNRFLRDRLDKEESEVTSHVEQCEVCQARLEALSQSGLSWDEAGQLLRPNEQLDLESTENESDETNQTPRFLRPSENPNSLGRFGRYEIMEVLGRGGMGIVMRGFDPALNRHSAIKLLTPELASSSAARRRFSREAKSAAAVVHPHVVPIHTVDQQDGLPYLVMPVIEGLSVDNRVRESGPLEIIEVIRIAAQVAEGLTAAHKKGLVHRDIKPANVLLESGVERVQITDFGLARAIDDASMTRSGVIAGTPQYMSPEQAHGDAIDHRSDLFSLGSLIYFMCSGHSPFRAETTMGVLNRIGNDQPRSLRSVNADVPAWLEQIVSRLLAKNPADRYQTAEEVADALNCYLAYLQTPDTQQPPEPASNASCECHVTGRRTTFGGKSRWLTMIVAAGLITFLGTLFVLETSEGTLRIETKGNIDVPIRIMQDKKTVKNLVVSESGSITRLKAGEYQIEIDGDNSEYRIHGGQVSIERGGQWLAQITLEPKESKGTSRAIQEPLSTELVDEPVQVLLLGPQGMLVSRRIEIPGATEFVPSPVRRNYTPGIQHAITFLDQGMVFQGILELPSGSSKTKAYFTHNALRVRITNADIDQIRSNNRVVRAFYMPTPEHSSTKLAGVETLENTGTESGIDVVVKAKRRGLLLGVLELKPPRQAIKCVNQIETNSEPLDSIKQSRPPSDEEVMKVLRQRWRLDDELVNIFEPESTKLRIVKELISDLVDPTRGYPLIGSAQLRETRWKCTVYFEQAFTAKWQELHNIDLNEIETVILTKRQLKTPGGTVFDLPTSKPNVDIR